MVMKFNRNEWFFFYLSIATIGIGMLNKVSSNIEYLLIFIGIFGMIITLLKSFWGKHSNNQNHFLKINIEALRAYLIEWYEPSDFSRVISTPER